MFSHCIALYVDDGPDFVVDRIVTARKRHKCCECGCDILPGEQYELTNGKWDGRMGRFRTCETCRRIRSSLFVDGWYYGLMWDDIHEAYCDDDSCICPDMPKVK